ncbi:unnamed protein product [Sphenostylis stenocarpa]|uniref:pyruvate kinase n=1 Tax=Sphenostylis stenocarpa TaxID=92480 RepID=A0AA86S1L5_9FABA|nr:unnamed protein product [Sphenostylis stenocarpa]
MVTKHPQINSSNGFPSIGNANSSADVLVNDYDVGHAGANSEALKKTNIVCTIGPSTSSRDMIWNLAEAGMNVARLNMSHGDHASHLQTIELVREYNAQFQDKVVAIMLDTKGPEVRSGDVPKPISLKSGQEFCFTTRRGVSTEDTVSVNYDGFVNDVEVGDVLLVDGKKDGLLLVNIVVCAIQID